MTDKILPVDLIKKSLALVERTHQTVSPRNLPRMIASKRNAVAVAMLPEAVFILRAAVSSFRLRVGCWAFAGLALVLSPLLTWWFLAVSALAIVAERAVAARERRFWLLLAVMLLGAEMLASDFAGWGTAYPDARHAAVEALGSSPSSAPIFEWLDYYLPRRDQIGTDLMTAFGPPRGAAGTAG